MVRVSLLGPTAVLKGYRYSEAMAGIELRLRVLQTLAYVCRNIARVFLDTPSMIAWLE